MNALVTFKDNEVALIRRTVARDCEPDEFNQFVHIARAVGLDPLRRQIYAFVFGKGTADRRLTVVTGIDGYRAISARAGDYRPDDHAPRIEYDTALKCPANPLGIVRAEVTLYKFAHGGWHPVIGEAHWDEYCPTTYHDDDVTWVDTGKTYPAGHKKAGKPIFRRSPKEGAQPIIDPSKTGWVKSPRNQIAKCAEAQAHRKGWPNDFAGLEVQEEVDQRHTLDLTATEIADKADMDDRLARIGGPNLLTVDWLDGGALAVVPADKFLGMAMDFVRKEDSSTIAVFQDRNRVTLQQFWGCKPGEALELKKEIEQRSVQAGETE